MPLTDLMPKENRPFAATELPTLRDVLDFVVRSLSDEPELYQHVIEEVAKRYRAYDRNMREGRIRNDETYEGYAENQLIAVVSETMAIDIDKTSDHVLMPVIQIEEDFDEDGETIVRISCEQALYPIDSLDGYQAYEDDTNVTDSLVISYPISGWGWELENWRHSLAHRVWIPSHFSIPQQVQFVADCFMELTFCGTTYESATEYQGEIDTRLDERVQALDDICDEDRLDTATTMPPLDYSGSFSHQASVDMWETIAKMNEPLVQLRLQDIRQLSELVKR